MIDIYFVKKKMNLSHQYIVFINIFNFIVR
jgi:hypothetical protein